MHLFKFPVKLRKIDIGKEYRILLSELEKFNPQMLDKRRVLAVTKSDLLDEDLMEMLREDLPDDLPVVYISAVTGYGIDQLKDLLWEELNSESNKLQSVAEGGSLVHRDRERAILATDFADWDPGLEEDIEEDEEVDDDIYDIEELED